MIRNVVHGSAAAAPWAEAGIVSAKSRSAACNSARRRILNAYRARARQDAAPAGATPWN